MTQKLTWADVERHNARVFAGQMAKPTKANGFDGKVESLAGERDKVAGDKSKCPISSPRAKSYSPKVVSAYFAGFGIPEPVFEHVFHPKRRWRFDLAWPTARLYLEVDGGIWVKGGHNRGAQMKKDWEKRNTATVLGWRGLWCEPKDLRTKEIAALVKLSLSTPTPEEEG